MPRNNTLILFIVVFVDMMGFSVIFPLFPETIRHFLSQGGDPLFHSFLSLADHLGSPERPEFRVVLFGGILGSIYSVLQFLFSPIWGRMSDVMGRRKILLLTSFGNFLGYVIWLFSDSFSLFVLSRIVTGAMGGNISVASAAMADVTTRDDRAKGMGMIGAGIGLGFIFGPLLGGLFSGSEIHYWFPGLQGWGFTVFSSSALVSILVAGVNLVLVGFFLQESLPSLTAHKAQDSGMDTVSMESAGGKTGVGVSDDRKANGGESGGGHSFHPFLDLLLPGFRGLLFVSILYFVFIFSFSGFEFSLNFFLNEEMEFTPRGIGYTFLYIGMIIIVIQGGVIRRLSGKVREISIAIAGVVTLGFGYLLLITLVRWNAVGIAGLWVSLGFLSVGSALLHPSLSSLASLGSSSDDQGKNLGIFRSFGSLARAVSPFSFALVYFWDGPYMVFAVALILSCFLGMGLVRFRMGRD